ncbi:MAG: ATP-binding cassette domain-containing protein, partial [Planctomycetota bacterium]
MNNVNPLNADSESSEGTLEIHDEDGDRNRRSNGELSSARSIDETATKSAVIRCEGLSKRSGDFQALRDCTLRVNDGVVFGLLGPTGAGKTTLIRSLLGYLR